MSHTQEFEFDAFEDGFNLTADEATDWPTLSMEFTFRTYAAEPDVGIFGVQIEVDAVEYALVPVEGAPQTYRTAEAFATAIYALIGDQIEEGEADVLKAITKAEADWEEELEA